MNTSEKDAAGGPKAASSSENDQQSTSPVESAPDAEHRRVERRATRLRLLLQTLGFSSLTYGAMILYYFQVLPLWGLIAANVLFYIRSYLRMHDLCHAFSTRWWPVRFLPTALFGNPVWGGVAPFITTHVQHHHYLGTNQDPWLQYYAGHPLRAFVCNMLEPDINLYNYVKQRGLERPLLVNLALDVARHATNLFVFRGAYLAHVIIQRACHGVGVFLFNVWPHRERFSADAPLGNWNRERELRPYAPILRLFFGRALVEAAMYHNRHHVLGQMLEPSHKYVLLSDEGRSTRFTEKWPLPSVQFLATGPKGTFG